MSSTLFTAWGYEVSILEFTAAVASFIGVYLGTTGKRITWPWWVLSSSLYGVFFYQVDLFASAMLQIIFMVQRYTDGLGGHQQEQFPEPFQPDFESELRLEQ
jgi:nicotinamide mononucleotide transporter